MNWIELESKNYIGITVKEVECPVCKHKETYTTDNPTNSCYVCGTVMRKEKGSE